MPVGSSTVGGDEDTAGFGILFLTHLLPPFFDGSNGEYRCIMVDADRHPGTVISQVIDAIGNGFTLGLAREVVGRHFDWFALRVPFLTRLSVSSDQLFFLGAVMKQTIRSVMRWCNSSRRERGVGRGVLILFAGL